MPLEIPSRAIRQVMCKPERDRYSKLWKKGRTTFGAMSKSDSKGVCLFFLRIINISTPLMKLFTAETGRGREKEHGGRNTHTRGHPPEGYVCRICSAVGSLFSALFTTVH
jgi:hypothetical protein